MEDVYCHEKERDEVMVEAQLQSRPAPNSQLLLGIFSHISFLLLMHITERMDNGGTVQPSLPGFGRKHCRYGQKNRLHFFYRTQYPNIL